MLPGFEPLLLSGCVVRLSCSFRNAQVAVGFSSVSPDDEARIEDWVAGEGCAVRTVACVIAATSLHVRMELARRLCELGARVTRARMPIELIQRLEGSRGGAAVVFLGETLGGCSDDEIATFLEAAYPWVRRVSVAADMGACGKRTLNRMHAAIEPPWRDDVLLEQLRSAAEPAGGG
jgi:hypothetical protein